MRRIIARASPGCAAIAVDVHVRLPEDRAVEPANVDVPRASVVFRIRVAGDHSRTARDLGQQLRRGRLGASSRSDVGDLERLIAGSEGLARPLLVEGAVQQTVAGDVKTLPTVHGLELKPAAARAGRQPLLVVSAVARPLNDLRPRRRAGAGYVHALAAVDVDEIEDVRPHALECPLLSGVPAASPLDDVGTVGQTAATDIRAFARRNFFQRDGPRQILRGLFPVVALAGMRAATQ